MAFQQNAFQTTAFQQPLSISSAGGGISYMRREYRYRDEQIEKPKPIKREKEHKRDEQELFLMLFLSI